MPSAPSNHLKCLVCKMETIPTSCDLWWAGHLHHLHTNTSSGIWLPLTVPGPANFTPCSRGTDSKSPKTGRKIFCRQPLLLALCNTFLGPNEKHLLSLLEGRRKRKIWQEKDVNGHLKDCPSRHTWVYGFCTSVIKRTQLLPVVSSVSSVC